MYANQYRRWSDNDRYFGPFTYARDGEHYRPIAIMLRSGDDEYPGCSLRFSGFGHTLIAALPNVLKPSKSWHDTSRYAWSNNPAGGYWEIHRREFGFTCHDGYLSVSHGRQTMDSSTDQNSGWFLPWTQWRPVRHSFYGLQGEHYWTEPSDWRGQEWFNHYEERKAITDACPSATFAFKDFDGELITATTHIEEHEHRFGTGWFKWLSAFRRSRVWRSLDIDFGKETGRRKGSWKGGTLGHSIEMLPGELHEAAFRRYCAEHEMTFLGSADAETASS